MANQKVHRIGLDVGSTTAKIVMLAENGQLEYAQYERHQANPQAVVRIFLEKMSEILKDDEFTFSVTGSVGLGMAERCGLHFVQEVVAATEFTKKLHPDVTTIIDIGGEDAKIVYLSGGQVTDLRMNGNCAGGTGAFIDQMALCLGVEVSEMDNLAKNAKIIYPIASRCGVFSKTDIQNLIARNATKEDIAASIFRAVAVQTASALSHGCQVRPTVMMCGGPLTFLPSLRKAIADYFQLDIDKDILHLEHANYVPAWGTAITFDDSKRYTVGSLKTLLYESDVERDSRGIEKKKYNYTVQMPPVFKDAQDYADWQKKKSESDIKFGTLKDLNDRPAYLGIDSGSTTTKIVLTDPDGKILFRHYAHNGGNPVEAVSVGLSKLKAQAEQEGVDVKIAAGCSTGYGEDLIKAAFSLNYGMIETMAHYVAAQNICPNVSFILDIGGQDMKAIYVENGILTRMEINEACSSGCGSFIETFAQTLGCEITEFVQEACKSQTPCDLGTRCTVFMNSKVKQVLREGYSLSDISAGLAYSVVKNCLFKVLKIKNYDELGGNIVLQGGTMRNDAIVKAFENLTQRNVYRNNIPELMGAYGCALYAAEQVGKAQVDARPLDTIMQAANYELDSLQCKGCENQCQITRYKFQTGQKFYSGNKCEKIFTNGANALYKGINMSDYKYRSLFKSELAQISEPKLKIGIPQVLNMFEEFPFWRSLFEECGIQVVLSPTSTYHDYEKGVHSVMSDNICFPAKLVHSHIYELAQMKVDRIFFPRVVYERVEDENSYNSFNCPIIIGYPDVVDSAIEVDVPIDSPIVAFKNNELMLKQIVAYLKTLGVKKSTAKAAVMKAIRDWDAWGEGLRAKNTEVYNKAEKEGRMTILLAGRPYHTDPLVQHNIADMIAKMGVDVITEEIARGGAVKLKSEAPEAFHIRQWSYVNRILNSAQWVAEQGANIHYVEMTSFGCGPDAFLTDEVRSILGRHGKSLTLLKIDDVNNIGSLKLRVRSLIESLKYDNDKHVEVEVKPFVKPQNFEVGDKEKYTILAPFFTEYMSPLLPSAFKAIGYELVALPMGDAESNELGLKYSNNEVCYPATIIVGDFIKALQSGKYDLNRTAVTITQLGQCRATNYPALIKKAFQDAGLSQVPVISMAGLDKTENPGFHLDFKIAGPIVLNSLLYGDWISIMYHATAVREIHKGDAKRLREKYLELAKPLIEAQHSKQLIKLLEVAAEEFNTIEVDNKTYPKAGIAGEIFLKFNPFSHKHVSDWLMDHGVEVCPPTFHNFFLKFLVNVEFNRKNNITNPKLPSWSMDLIYKLIYARVHKFEKAASKFRYFEPEPDIRTIAQWAEEVLCLSVQSGEGWLLPAETIQYIKQGCNNVVSLQPFGCIANHIAARGIEKKIKTLYPQLNMLALDFDGGVSEANIANRLLLFISNMK